MVTLGDLPLRTELQGLEPYGAPMIDVPVALNVNENTHPVPAHVAQHIADELLRVLPTVNRYPDREFTRLREALAEYIRETTGEREISAASIWAANGSNEVLQHVLQAFGGSGRSVLAFTPTYSMHSVIAHQTGTTWLDMPRTAQHEIDVEAALRDIAVHQPEVVFVCTPNNPTGTPIEIGDLERIVDAAPGVVVVDEAYFEFAPEGACSAVTLLRGRPRLIVSRTMSKAFAFAGVRLGYLVADEAVCDAMRIVRLPYHLSTLTQVAATTALAHTDEMLAMVDDIRRQRDRIVAAIGELGYRAFASWSNFVLFDGVDDPAAVWSALLARGVLIRDVGLPGALRVSAGTEAETTAFIEALTEVTRERRLAACDAR